MDEATSQDIINTAKADISDTADTNITKHDHAEDISDETVSASVTCPMDNTNQHFAVLSVNF